MAAKQGYNTANASIVPAGLNTDSILRMSVLNSDRYAIIQHPFLCIHCTLHAVLHASHKNP